MTLIREEGLSQVDAVKIDVEGRPKDIILIPFLCAMIPASAVAEALADREHRRPLGTTTSSLC